MNRFHPCALLLLVILSPYFASAQGTISTSLTLTATPSTLLLGQQTVVTATISVSSGPVSATDGLLLQVQTTEFSKAVTLENGFAAFDFTPQCASQLGCESVVTVSFLAQGNFGPSSANTTITVEPPPAALINGAYAFRFSGQSRLPGGPTDVAAVGSLRFDGAGSVTGLEDVNSGAGQLTSLHVAGTYTLGATGVGSMTLTSAEGAQIYSLYVPSSNPNTTPSTATFLETDGFVAGNGVLSRQDTSGIDMALDHPGSAYGKGTYSVQATGATACLACNAVGHAAGPVLVSGQLALALDGGVAGTFVETIASQVAPLRAVSGSATVFDGNGRLTFAAAAPQSSADQPSHFVAYVIDAYHFYFLSTDVHTQDILLSGTATQLP